MFFESTGMQRKCVGLMMLLLLFRMRWISLRAASTLSAEFPWTTATYESFFFKNHGFLNKFARKL